MQEETAASTCLQGQHSVLRARCDTPDSEMQFQPALPDGPSGMGRSAPPRSLNLEDKPKF